MRARIFWERDRTQRSKGVRRPAPAQLIRSDLECVARTKLPINHCAEMLTQVLRSGGGAIYLQEELAKKGSTFTEKEVNAFLAEFYDDYAVLRRYLVDYGYLSRD